MKKQLNELRIYGINIKTNIDLPIKPEKYNIKETEPFFTITQEEELQNEDSFQKYASNQRGNVIFKRGPQDQYLIETDMMGKILVDSNNAKYVRGLNDLAVMGADGNAAFMLGYGMGIAMLLRLNQYSVIHANALLISDKVVLIMGDSGMGKSTFCSYLIEKCGAKLIADDMACIRNGKLYSGMNMIKLWPETIHNIMKTDKEKYQRVGVSDKRYVSVPQIEGEKYAITDLVFLQKNEENKEVMVRDLGSGEACGWLLKNIYNKFSLDGKLFLQEIKILTEMMNQLPINSHIIYSPRTFDALGKMAAVI